MMKKLILSFVALALCFGALASTDGKHNIGLRLGYGAEVSYQYNFSKKNRLEADLGLSSWGMAFGVAASYQWTWDIKPVQGLGWYVGPAIGLSAGHGFNIALGGQIGLEYNFNFPLQLTLDYRPLFLGLGFGDGASGYYYNAYGFAISARYRL